MAPAVHVHTDLDSSDTEMRLMRMLVLEQDPLVRHWLLEHARDLDVDVLLSTCPESAIETIYQAYRERDHTVL